MGAVVPLITPCFKPFLISTDRQVKSRVPVEVTATHLPKQQRPHRLSSFSSPSATLSFQVIQNSPTMTGIKPNSSPSVTDIHSKKRSQSGRPRARQFLEYNTPVQASGLRTTGTEVPIRGWTIHRWKLDKARKENTSRGSYRPLFSGLRPSPAESLRTHLEIQEPVQLLKMKFRLLKMLIWKEALVSIRETNSMASHPISGPANHPHQ